MVMGAQASAASSVMGCNGLWWRMGCVGPCEWCKMECFSFFFVVLLLFPGIVAADPQLSRYSAYASKQGIYAYEDFQLIWI